MSVNVPFNGETHVIPTSGEKGWAAAVTAFIVSVGANALTAISTLAAELDLGATYGIRAMWFRSKTSNPATTGVVRLAQTDQICFRNAANDTNLTLGLSSDVLQFMSVALVTRTATETLTNKTLTAPTITAPAISGSINIDDTDSSGTPGNVTINKPAGKFAVAIGAASVTVTNSLVTAASHVFCQLQFADATHTEIRTVVPGVGSFVYTGNANATAATKVAFIVIN
jgi:hypothetical protein